MHCPQCGHRQNSDEIRFCAKCGFNLKGVKELLAPEKYQLKAKENKARIKGFRQGGGLIVFGFMLTCVLYILSQLNVVPGSYCKIAFMSFLTLGMARACIPVIIGELKSEKKREDLSPVDGANQTEFPENPDGKALPEAEYRPEINFGTKKFDTNELVSPSSITEETTKNLKKEFQPE